MAEPESPPPTPENHPPGTASWVSVPPFDVAAVEPTAAYPVNPTASFPGPSAGEADAETATAVGGEAQPGDGSADDTPHPGAHLPQIPGYEVLRVIGDGGMGTVFKARHVAMDKIVALKLIKAGWGHDDDLRVRFAREVKALARLEHPNVIPIYDADSWQGLPYMTMKFVAGKTLYHHLERVRSDLRAAVRLMIQVARAVQYLHAYGIIHRDLKPLNILLGENDTPLVADFGLVRLQDENSDLSITLVALGTRQYMSPEQTLGGRENYTCACDIWALGVIIFELLAGHRPFGHDDTAELYRQIRFDPVPPLPPTADAPSSLEAVARKCLAKAVADRYATAEDVAADLERWLAGEVIPLPPPDPVVRAPEPVAAPPAPAAPRRYRWAVAAVLLLSTLGFSGLPPQPPRETESPRQRTTAERLAAREKVWLIPEKGLPARSRDIPGCNGTLFVGPTGHAALTSAVYAAVELSWEDLPWPVKFRAEYAVTGAQDFSSRIGVFAGHRPTTAGGSGSSLIELTHREEHVRDGKGTDRVTRVAGFEFEAWDRFAPEFRRAFTAIKDEKSVPDKLPTELDWHTVEVVIRPESLRGSWNGRDLEPVFGPRVDGQKGQSVQPPLERWGQERLLLDPRAAPLALAPRYIGSGLGICVFNAGAVFRNITLEPTGP